MAKTGVKSKTIVHEIVMMLYFFPSLVVTRTTGPDSINVKALLIFNFFMCALLYIIFRLTTVGRFKDTKMGIDAAFKVSDDQGATVASYVWVNQPKVE